MSLKKYQIISIIVACFFVGSCSILRTLKIMNGGSVEKGTEYTTKFEVIGKLIILKVKINGGEKEYDFIFDTGAVTAIDKKLAKELNLAPISKVEAKDASNTTDTVRVFKLDHIQLGNILEKDIGVVAIDLAFVNKMLDHHVDGIIGNNFFKFFKITLNYQEHTLSLSNKTEAVKSVANGYVINFWQDLQNSFAPKIKCEIKPGIVMDGVIDSGCEGSVCVPSGKIKNGDLLQSNPNVEAQGTMSAGAFGKNTKDYMLRVNDFSIDSLHVSNLLITNTPGKVCLIGSDFLSQFIVTINYPAHQLILVPIQSQKFPHNSYSLGFGATKTDSGYYKVIGIWNSSPADSAGIKLNDKITEINSIKAENISGNDFYKMVNSDSTSEFNLVISSEGIERNILLKKRMLLKQW